MVPTVLPKVLSLNSFKAKYYILLSLSLLTSYFPCHALNYDSINTLSNVTKIIQDKHGFIWLAGQQGLTRVDGDRSITFSLNNQEWPQPYSWIHDITLINNKILLSTETEGLWLFDTLNAESEKIPVDIKRQSHYSAVMFQKKYYIYAPNKLYRYDTTTKETDIIDNNITLNVISNTQKQLYVGTSEGLYQLKNYRLVLVIDEPTIALTSLSNAIIAITPKHIYRVRDNGEVLNISLSSEVYAVTKAFNSDDFFTVNNQGKVTKYSNSTLSEIPHHYDDSDPVRIRSIFHDASGVLWISSSSGIQQLNENYITNRKVTFDIPINANEITLLDGEIIIGSYGAGLQNFLNPIFTNDINNFFSTKGLKIFDLLEVNDKLFIASLDGLWGYNKKTKQLNKLNVIPEQLILKLEHKDNLLYIATNYNGLYIYNLKSKKIVNHLSTKNGLANQEVIDVLPLNSGRLWIASNNNINIYHPSLNKIEILNTPNKSKVISLVYADNKIFASTLGDGILVFNKKGDLLAQISIGHSFTEMLLVNDEIWVSGKPGLYRLSPKNYQITMIANTQQYSFVSSMLVKDETLYAIHYSGVLALNLSEQVQFNPNVTISKTTISGQSYLLNKSIKISSGNDVVTLDLASLDYRPGLEKKFQYSINNNAPQTISGSQLTLTGLASGNYNIEIMATNSLGQWSDVKAYTEINVAYPWYWTKTLKIIYFALLLFIVLLMAWLLYLRTKSIKHIHHLLTDDMRNYGRLMKTIQRNLQLTSTYLENNELEQGKVLIKNSLLALKETVNAQEPDNLAGKNLSVAISFLSDYIYSKYEVKLHVTYDDEVNNVNYELQADVYKVIYESLMSAIFKSEAKNLNLVLQEVKKKLWLTVNSDNNSFGQLNSKINFDLASYTIRQIINKNYASLNTFDNEDGSSQLVISFPLMSLN